MQIQDRLDYKRWEMRYILLLWLSLVVRVPFDLSRLDSSTENSLIEVLLNLGRSYLDASGKEREAAAEFLARLLTRKDTVHSALPSFVSWAVETAPNETSIFKVMGILLTLASIYKYGQRESLRPLADQVIPLCEILLSPKSRFASNSIVRKYAVKLTQRLGLAFLKPVVAPWRYQRGLHATPCQEN